SFSRQSIPHPRLAQQVAGMRRIRFDLLSELRDEHPEVLRLIDGTSTPDRLQNGAMRQDAVWISRQQREEVELFRSEANLVFAAEYAVAIVIDRHVADLQAAGGILVR